jgi:hypothetical protein
MLVRHTCIGSRQASASQVGKGVPASFPRVRAVLRHRWGKTAAPAHLVAGLGRCVKRAHELLGQNVAGFPAVEGVCG